ncbi:hypothetical protein EYF80_039076 [Liparis tanakae]|uniref:Uncharacterized protein n=1 Tax=Liparis tanakae TaxID=230148 RepID=A0A4Z2GCA9_9TELE|nr:hypothetical protein EYF80_039076 [Liparis tanakae]
MVEGRGGLGSLAQRGLISGATWIITSKRQNHRLCVVRRHDYSRARVSSPRLTLTPSGDLGVPDEYPEHRALPLNLLQNTHGFRDHRQQDHNPCLPSVFSCVVLAKRPIAAKLKGANRVSFYFLSPGLQKPTARQADPPRRSHSGRINQKNNLNLHLGVLGGGGGGGGGAGDVDLVPPPSTPQWRDSDSGTSLAGEGPPGARRAGAAASGAAARRSLSQQGASRCRGAPRGHAVRDPTGGPGVLNRSGSASYR